MSARTERNDSSDRATDQRGSPRAGPWLFLVVIGAALAAIWLLREPGWQRITSDEVGVSFAVPATFSEQPGPWPLVLADPGDDQLLVIADRHVRNAYEFEVAARLLGHELASSVEILGSEQARIGGRPAWVFRLTYEDAVEPGVQIRERLHLVDAGDGTSVLVSVVHRGGEPDAEDALPRLVESVSVDNVELPVVPRQLAMDTDGFVGEYWTGRVVDPQPAVLVIGGSEGGLQSVHGAQLARSGHPTLALAYWAGRPALQDLPGLPNQLAEIPLEYFETALRWLADRPEVDPDRIYLWGTSRGGEAALLIASTYPELVHGVIANVPANRVVRSFPDASTSAWSRDGVPLPVTQTSTVGRIVAPEPDAEIPVERIDGPVLLTCGERDLTWASCPMSRAIVDRLDRHDHPHPVELLAYEELGHQVNMPPSSIIGAPSAGDEAWQRALDFIHETS